MTFGHTPFVTEIQLCNKYRYHSAHLHCSHLHYIHKQHMVTIEYSIRQTWAEGCLAIHSR